MHAKEQRTIAALIVLRVAAAATRLCHALSWNMLAAGSDCRVVPSSTIFGNRNRSVYVAVRSIWQGGFGDPLWCTGACTTSLSPLVQVIREALTKDFAAMLEHDQPYERALYSTSQLLEARKWHVSQYLVVLSGLQPHDLLVHFCRSSGFKYIYVK